MTDYTRDNDREVIMDPNPKIVQKTPFVVDEKAGKYAWCSCGKSENQPYCDGSHKADGLFRPMTIEIPEDKKVAWCGCKHTNNQPFCDGSHKDLV